MENFFIIVLLAIIVFFGIRSSAAHFRGQGGCCGGGGYRHKRKRLKNVICKKTFKVDGMKCANCKARVEELVDGIDGLSGKVDLKKGELTVSYAKPVDDGLIKERIERAGYRVQ